ncbi:hypothetical protein TNCV_878231 [Trichonephila clavipes]|nr:hypothetical protein TNCV_878231 [Trichonephila clavipes]
MSKIVHLVKQNRRQTVKKLTVQYDAVPNANISEHAAQLTLLDMGLRIRRPIRGFLLIKRHCQLRLELAEHNCGSVARLSASVFITGNGIFQQDSVPCQKARIILEEFEEKNSPSYDYKSMYSRQLKSFSPVSSHLSEYDGPRNSGSRSSNEDHT